MIFYLFLTGYWYTGNYMTQNANATITFSNGTVLTLDNYKRDSISFGGWEKVKMLNYTQTDTDLHYFRPWDFSILIGKYAVESL